MYYIYLIYICGGLYVYIYMFILYGRPGCRAGGGENRPGSNMEWVALASEEFVGHQISLLSLLYFTVSSLNLARRLVTLP